VSAFVNPGRGAWDRGLIELCHHLDELVPATNDEELAQALDEVRWMWNAIRPKSAQAPVETITRWLDKDAS